MNAYLLYLMGHDEMGSMNEKYKQRRVISSSSQQFLTARITKEIDQEEVLRFDSQFESGNLARVYCVNNAYNAKEYDLYLNVDTNTRGHI
jgi:hypothetical protein